MSCFNISSPGKREILYNKSERVNYAQKPEALLERIILAATKPNDLILDPFCGTATTIVAGQRLGRRVIGLDNDGEMLSFADRRIQAIKQPLF